VATFNGEWLGYPGNSGSWSGSRSSQIQTAAGEILALDADIVALQEVIIDALNGNALDDLIAALNTQDPSEIWAGVSNPKFSYWWDPDFEAFPAQRQAYVWKTSTVTYLSSEVMLGWIPAGDPRFGSGRLPFLLTVMAGPLHSRRQVQLINLHLKCCRGSDDRRWESMTTLLPELYNQYADNSLIVLGDFNVADRGGAYGEISEWGFYDDDDGDGEPDFAHIGGAVADLSWSDIDHIMVSNELLPNWERVPGELQDGIVTSTVSDHSFVYARMDFGPPPVAEQYDLWLQPYITTDPAFALHSGFEDDYDKDGLANGLEFMTGTSPLHPNTSDRSLTIQTGTPDGLQLSYYQRQGLPVSSLSLWTTSDPGNPPWSLMTPAAEDLTIAEDIEPGFDRITIRVQLPENSVPLFFRLQASLEP
jgi:endonuclease/exonuclease/phosphatase family metal-dependent hydrolase